MLTSVHIRNFRSCKDVRLDGLGAIVALAGRNGAGKSNILQAIDCVARFATSGHWRLGHLQAFFAEGCEGELSFKVGGAAYCYEARTRDRTVLQRTVSFSVEERLREISNDGREIVLLDRRGETVDLGPENGSLHIGAATSAMPATLALLPTSAPTRRALERVFGFLSAVRYYPLDEPNQPDGDVIAHSEYMEWIPQFNSSPADDDSVPMRLLHLHKTSPDRLAELRDIIGDNGLSLISEIQISELGPTNGTVTDDRQQFYLIRFRPSDYRTTVEYGGLSQGTRRVLRIVASVVLDDSAVMLVEQPEDNIHSGLMKKVISLLRQHAARIQFFLASHSATVFNKMAPEEVRLVALKNGETVVRALTASELHDADGPDPAVNHEKVRLAIVKPCGLEKSCCIVIPVQELEAWLLADLDAVRQVVKRFPPARNIASPELINDPKERLERMNADPRGKRSYDHARHNEKVAAHLDLERVRLKCPSYRPFEAFVLGTAQGTGETP